MSDKVKEPTIIVDEYLNELDWRVKENSNQIFSFSGLNLHIASSVIAMYTLNKIYPKNLAKRHSDGWFHIHDLGQGIIGYSFHKDNVVLIRENKKDIKCISMKDLFEKLDLPIYEENGFEIKYPENLEVWDRSGWVKVLRVLRHRSNKKILSISSSNGYSLMVTPDHDCFVLKHTVCSTCKEEIVVNGTRTYGRLYKCKKCNKNWFINENDLEEVVVKAKDIKERDLIYTFTEFDQRRIKKSIPSDIAWLIGIFLSKGTKLKESCDTLYIYIKFNSDIVKKIEKISNKYGFTYTVSKSKDCITIGVNKEYQNYLKDCGIVRYDKKLPDSFLEYDDKSIASILCGIIDRAGIISFDRKGKRSLVFIRMESGVLLNQLNLWLHMIGIKSHFAPVHRIRNYNGSNVISKGQLYCLEFYIPKRMKHLFEESLKINNVDFVYYKKELSEKEINLVKRIYEFENDDEYVYDITTETNSLYASGIKTHQCSGWSLRQLISKGFGGVSAYCEAKPAKHLDSIVWQMINFLGVVQNEWAGAQAFNSVDTYLAPYIRKDKLDYKQVKQCMQAFIYNSNIPSRWGGQAPFINVTMDLTPPEDLKNQPAIVGNEIMDYMYGDLQEEMDMINRAFLEIMLEGDARGKPFTFPIPTYNITKDFDWDSDIADLLFEVTGKYGIPYFQNFVNSDLNPGDVRSMCLFEDEEIIIRKEEKIKRIKIKDLEKEFKCVYDNEGWAEVNEDIETISLNPHTYKLEWIKIKRLYKTKDNVLIKIKTKDGKEIKVTEDHPVAIYTSEGIKYKKAKELTGEELLLTTKNGESLLNTVYQFLHDEALDEDLAFLLGLFVADGNYLFNTKGKVIGIQYSFHLEDRELIEKVKKLIFERYGYNIKLKKDPRYNCLYGYIYNSKLAEKWYKAGFLKYGRLPDILFNSPKSVIKAFLEGFFAGKGYKVSKEIHINDEDLARDLVILMNLVGIPNTYRKRENSQVIRIQHINGRGSKKNLNKVEILYNRYPKYVLTNKHPIYYSLGSMVCESTILKYGLGSKEFKKLKDGDFAIVKIEKIEKFVSDQEMNFYDIELERNHYFIHSLGNITHNCCRLQLDLTELKKKTGGLFGAGETTGSVGVVTINLPRLGYLAKDENEFFELLEELMNDAKDVLEIKRKVIQKNYERGLMPYTKVYLKGFDTYFSTIGLVGMNEACLNLLEVNIADPEGHKFAIKVLDFMRDKIKEFQEETGNLYNLEATPAESTAYRLARIDKKKYSDIIVANEFTSYKETGIPYYTNSTHLPVDYTDDLFFTLKHQEPLQSRYTGGTVLHMYLDEPVDKDTAKLLIKKAVYGFRIPYYSISPRFSICPVHGYIPGWVDRCPY